MAKYDKYSWGIAPPPIPEEEICETVRAQVVIVGAGLSGVSAAARCGELGLKTVLLEKGKRNSARGLHVGVANSRLLRQNGIENNIDDITREWMTATGHRAKIDIIRTFLKESEPAMDWLLDKTDARGIHSYIFGGGYHGEAYKEFVCTHIFAGGVEGLASLLLEEALSYGLDYRVNTSACQLIKEQGRVIGVIARSKGQEGYTRYLAEKGVVLATGDISGNRQMCEDLAPFALKATTNINHHAPQLTGDGHRMGIWAGADMQEGPFPFAMHIMAYSINSFYFLLVNQQGRRYMNEDCWAQGKATYTVRHNPDYPYGYVIFDSDYLQDLSDTIQYGGGLFWDSTVRPYGTPFDPRAVEYAVNTCVEEGIDGWKDDTLEGLAAQLGIPAGELTKTVDRYNELCDRGNDEDFGKRKELMSDCRKGPFYALKISGSLLHIPAGLSMNARMQVLDTKQQPIEGLYAVGNVAGDLYAIDYPLLINGSCHGRCITFGKLTAEILAGIK